MTIIYVLPNIIFDIRFVENIAEFVYKIAKWTSPKHHSDHYRTHFVLDSYGYHFRMQSPPILSINSDTFPSTIISRKYVFSAHKASTNKQYMRSYSENSTGVSEFELNGYSTISFLNSSENGTELDLKHPIVGICLSCFSFITIVGNLMVIIAVFKEIYLRTVTNYFIVSLAVADMMVGGVVMPFSISHEMTNQKWLYGQEWCDLWHSLDVLASTASILNLCVISLDRYWAITDPIAYPGKMNTCKVCLLITFVWLCSAGISFPAIAWWKAVTPPDLTDHLCLFTEDSGYLIFSSIVSFYTPMFIMLFVYYRIYVAAVAQTKGLKSGTKIMTNGLHGEGEVMTLRIHRGGIRRLHDEISTAPTASLERSTSDSDGESPSHTVRHGTNHYLEVEDHQHHHHHHHHHHHLCRHDQHQPKLITKRLRHFAISKKLTKLAREQKAAKTLGIVVGVFIMCWLPFFVTNVLLGICHLNCVLYPDIIYPVFTWLGYINSGMNPIIYALSMRDFRRAFGKLIFVCCPRYRFRQPKKKCCHNSMSTSSFSVNCGDRCVALKI
ncbi:dopamine receptor 2-like [Gigantopelta aegis]|uniref:dopamine receptor 2-like n=1 Tax=Gigantopelta aegis TaxID=1735272 RepID=UPI001B88E623|nr:dopamine receptor 2-like [Gigantopelta aegis]